MAAKEAIGKRGDHLRFRPKLAAGARLEEE
jgi:hypothetical protein